jgi:tetratricopeptide (TPR) repeat protein
VSYLFPFTRREKTCHGSETPDCSHAASRSLPQSCLKVKPEEILRKIQESARVGGAETSIRYEPAQEAIDAYSKYLAIKPDNADMRTDMAIVSNIGDIERALQEFGKALRSDPKHMNSRYNIGIVLLHDKGDIKGAIRPGRTI